MGGEVFLMGLDPIEDDYTEGALCAECVDSLFNGVTPETVRVTFFWIEKCPISPWEPPNGTWELTQVPGFPCRWFLQLESGMGFLYECSPVSKVWATAALGAVWFFFGIDIACVDVFDNFYEACGDDNYGKNGKALITWGPDKPCFNE